MKACYGVCRNCGVGGYWYTYVEDKYIYCQACDQRCHSTFIEVSHDGYWKNEPMTHLNDRRHLTVMSLSELRERV